MTENSSHSEGNATSSGEPKQAGYFVTTRWTVVLSAGRKSSAQAERALGELCQTYWYPLYAYVRRRGYSKEDAEDLTQAFFARFLEKNYLDGLSAERGKFRAFLLASLKHFLANEWDKANRQKRGGGAEHLSLDLEHAEERFQHEPPDITSPDQIYDREWALAVLERVILLLRDECAADGKAALFDQARGYLMVGEAAIPYGDAARALGLDDGAVRVAVHRLRKRYRELLREEIAQTLVDGAQVDDELRSLHAALRAR